MGKGQQEHGIVKKPIDRLVEAVHNNDCATVKALLTHDNCTTSFRLESTTPEAANKHHSFQFKNTNLVNREILGWGSLLNLAIGFKRPCVAKILLEHNASMDKADDLGKTPRQKMHEGDKTISYAYCAYCIKQKNGDQKYYLQNTNLHLPLMILALQNQDTETIFSFTEQAPKIAEIIWSRAINYLSEWQNIILNSSNLQQIYKSYALNLISSKQFLYKFNSITPQKQSDLLSIAVKADDIITTLLLIDAGIDLFTADTNGIQPKDNINSQGENFVNKLTVNSRALKDWLGSPSSAFYQTTQTNTLVLDKVHEIYNICTTQVANYASLKKIVQPLEPKEQASLLNIAIREYNKNLIIDLIKANVNPLAKSANDITPADILGMQGVHFTMELAKNEQFAKSLYNTNFFLPLIQNIRNKSDKEAHKLLLQGEPSNFDKLASYSPSHRLLTLKEAILNECYIVFNQLMELKWDNLINIPDNSGTPLIHYAMQKGNKAMVTLLEHKGADPQTKDSFGRTAFYYAANKQNTNPDYSITHYKDSTGPPPINWGWTTPAETSSANNGCVPSAPKSHDRLNYHRHSEPNLMTTHYTLPEEQATCFHYEYPPGTRHTARHKMPTVYYDENPTLGRELGAPLNEPYFLLPNRFQIPITKASSRTPSAPYQGGKVTKKNLTFEEEHYDKQSIWPQQGQQYSQTPTPNSYDGDCQEYHHPPNYSTQGRTTIPPHISMVPPPNTVFHREQPRSNHYKKFYYNESGQETPPQHTQTLSSPNKPHPCSIFQYSMSSPEEQQSSVTPNQTPGQLNYSPNPWDGVAPDIFLQGDNETEFEQWTQNWEQSK